MAHLVSITELRNMQLPDLIKETTSQRAEVAKLGHAVKSRQEKNSAKYKVEKKQLARMKTILTEKMKSSPQAK